MRPWLLRLPRRAMLRGIDVACLARAEGDVRDPREIEHRFGLHRHEQKLVVELLRARPQLWVFRCDQLRACGDVALIDMSAIRALRRCVVLELKQSGRFAIAPRHRQLVNHAHVVDELVRRGLLDEGATAIACVDRAFDRW